MHLNLIILVILFFQALQPAHAAGKTPKPTAQSNSSRHAIVFLSGDDDLPEGYKAKAGDIVSTRHGAHLRLPNGSNIELGENTSLRLTKIGGDSQATTLDLFSGNVRSSVLPMMNKGSSFSVKTPIATVGVRGTDFSVSYEPAAATSTQTASGSSEVDVFEGTVQVDQDGKSESIKSGNGLTLRRRAMIKRKIKEKIREKWESRRDNIISKVQKRYKISSDKDAKNLRKLLKKLPPEVQEEIKKKIKTRIKKAIERAKKRKAKRTEAQKKKTAARRKAAKSRREVIKDRRNRRR